MTAIGVTARWRRYVHRIIMLGSGGRLLRKELLCGLFTFCTSRVTLNDTIEMVSSQHCDSEVFQHTFPWSR